MKPFDEKFAENVREVFDAWQQPVDEQAWRQMEARLGKKSKPAFFVLWPIPAWSVAVAASVLLLVSVTIWQIGKVSDHKTMTTAEQSLQPGAEPENNLLIREFAGDETQPIIDAQDDYEMQSVDEKPMMAARLENVIDELKVDGIPNESVRKEEMRVVDPDEYAETTPFAEIDNHPPDQVAEALIDHADDLTIENSESKSLVMPQVDNRKIIEDNIYYLNDNQSTRAELSGIEFSAGSIKTYSMVEMAEGLGYSAGVTGHWPINKRLSLGGGGVFVYNQFSLNNPDLAYWSSSRKGDLALDEGAFYGDNTRVIDRNKRTDVEFMAIDIPVNFRYRLTNMARGEFYVSAGLSSLIYLQQSYHSQSDLLLERSTLSGIDTQFSRSNVSETTSGDYDAFNRVDLGRFLNLSMGYIIKRERHSLLIEPYIKYPLGHVTSLDLQIYMAGVSLKYQLAKP